MGDICPGNINAGGIGRETAKVMSVAKTNQHRPRKQSSERTGSRWDLGEPTVKGQIGEEALATVCY